MKTASARGTGRFMSTQLELGRLGIIVDQRPARTRANWLTAS